MSSIPVEVKLHFRFTRCPGPFALGNLLYTNTLFPGEKVKLFTSDRRTKFTYDSASQVSYRNTQTSEESHYAQQFRFDGLSSLGLPQRYRPGWQSISHFADNST